MNQDDSPIQPGKAIRGVRGKYAAAFEKGVDVIVRDETGRETRRRVRRLADGTLSWERLPAARDRAIDEAA